MKPDVEVLGVSTSQYDLWNRKVLRTTAPRLVSGPPRLALDIRERSVLRIAATVKPQSNNVRRIIAPMFRMANLLHPVSVGRSFGKQRFSLPMIVQTLTGVQKPGG